MNSLSNMIISVQARSLNRQIFHLIVLLQIDEEDEWFRSHLKEIEVKCEEIEEMNPIR